MTKYRINGIVDLEPVGPTPPADWPNEPSGLTVVSQWPMTDPIPPGPPPPMYSDDPLSNGWRIAYNHPPGSIWPEGNDPFTGTPFGWCAHDTAENCVDMNYPIGMRLGCAPSTIYNSWGMSLNYRRCYFATHWKISDPYDYDNVGSKMLFLFNGGGGVGGQAFISMGTDQLVVVMPEYPDPPPTTPAYRVRTPNVNATQVTRNVWHLLEWYMEVPQTKQTPGVIRWWLDGVLQGDYSDVWNDWPFDMAQFSPTFGGNGDFFKHTHDHQWFKNCRVSVGTLPNTRVPMRDRLLFVPCRHDHMRAPDHRNAVQQTMRW